MEGREVMVGKRMGGREDTSRPLLLWLVEVKLKVSFVLVLLTRSLQGCSRGNDVYDA